MRSSRSDRSSRSRWRSRQKGSLADAACAPRAVLHALDGRVRREAALHRFAQAPLPAAIVGEHAVGFEHVAVLAGRGQVLVRQHLVERER